MHTCLYQKNIMPGRDTSAAEHVVGRLSEIKRILWPDGVQDNGIPVLEFTRHP
jgi:hypothetical protein